MTTHVTSPASVHPAALCESNRVGDGTHIKAFAHVMDGATIGRNCNIGVHAFVESGARVGNGVVIKSGVMICNGVEIDDYAFIGPGVVFTNDRYPRSRHAPAASDRYEETDRWLEKTQVGSGASIGAHATIVCGVSVGQYAMIAAGALVTRDVRAFRLVSGSPARPVGWACMCGRRLGEWFSCATCGRTYRLENQVLAPEQRGTTALNI